MPQTHPRPRATARKLLAVGFQRRVRERLDRPEDNDVRKHITWASALLALTIGAVSGCGGSQTAGSSPPTSSCVNQSAAHHAYLVVMHASAKVIQKCVGFTGDSIDAQTLMDQSTVEYQTQTYSFGKAVCQVDNEPAQFTKCFADSGPNWTLFVESGGQWTEAQTGYTEVTLHDKDALGWVYTASPSPSPPPAARELG
ncbi:MAG TPA: hypothetical protein VEU76_01370 [Candidatus Udaeobacter sp.]|nr:hypothetical protein [Candidatus Udaeobacter sp.]